MSFFQKIVGVAAIATLAMSVVATAVSAHNPTNHKAAGGIIPALLGPVGAAGAVGTTTSTLHWTTTKMIPWSKTFTWTKIIQIPTQVQTNTYWIKNVVGQGQGIDWVQVNVNAYNNVNLNTHIREIRLATETINVPKEITKTKTVNGEKKVTKNHSKSSKSRSAQGKMIVGCIMGSALGAITASVRKASAKGNPPRWRSQAEHEKIVASGYEKQFELTSQEASTALALCGLGSFALHWEKSVPVKAKVAKARS
jgi:hypothetical protein